MARKAQKLINYHGTIKANLESTKEQLNLGEIAVVHNETEPLLAIRVSGDSTDKIAYFADSASTSSAINTVSTAVTALEQRVQDIETGATSEALQEIEVSGGTYVKLNVSEKVGNKQTISVEDTIVSLADATGETKGLAEASDVKTYVDAADVVLSGNVHNAITQVKATADSALKDITAAGDTFVTASVTGEGTTKEITIASVTGTVANGGETLTVASDVKSYVDTQVANKNVTASGDSYVEASASGNKVTVKTNAVIDLSDTGLTATGKVADAKAVKDYVDSTKSKLQSSIDEVSGKVTTLIGEDTGKSVRTVAKEEASIAVATIVSGAPEAFDTLVEIADWIQTSGSSAASVVGDVVQLKKDVDALEQADTLIADALSGVSATVITALQSIEKGSDGEYVTTTIGEKSGNKQTIGVSVTVQEITGATGETKGLAEASDVKSYVDTAVSTAKSDITTAYTAADAVVEGKITTLSGDVHNAITQVKATADSALKGITATGDTFVTASVTGEGTTKEITIASVTGTVENGGETLTVARDVKSYVDAKVSSSTNNALTDIVISGITGVDASESGHQATIDFTNMVIDCGEF